jgi:hypothetical protein
MKNTTPDELSDEPATVKPLHVLIDETHLKLYHIIELMDISKKSWYNKMERPGSFTVNELYRLTDILNKAKMMNPSKPTVTILDVMAAIDLLYQQQSKNEKVK